MSVATAPQVQCKTESDVRNVAVSFAELLDTGELLTGTPTIVEVTTSDLTLGSKVVNTAALTILGESVAIGQAVQFSVSGGDASTKRYTIKITATTDSSPAQTLVRNVELDVIADSS